MILDFYLLLRIKFKFSTVSFKFGMKVKSADDFLTDIIDLNPAIALQAFKALVMNRTNPEMNEFEVLEILRNRGLLNTANYLHALI